ncbi:MAG: hypothetical protein JW847_07845 [Candidatus Omnitrophica bacterium]|nr:hypothetical protein [Candidatus Omnitrophota bacterium]
MDETYLGRVINFLSGHFELVIAINGAILFSYLAVMIFVRMREINFLAIWRLVFRKIPFVIVVGGQCVLFIIYGQLYWANYKKPAPELHLEQHVAATTQWVKDDTWLYFVDGHMLRAIRINDRDVQDVFSASDPVKEYHFSPDGKYIAVLTQKDLFLLEGQTKRSEQIDSLKDYVDAKAPKEDATVKGTISGIRWAPDSRKFIYEKAWWSQFSSQDNVYLYDLREKKKKMIQSPTRRISSLYWDVQSQNLYYLYHESKDPSDRLPAYEVAVFRVPLATDVPELIVRIPSEEASVPIENLNLRGIDLYLNGNRLSFGVPGKENDLVSEKGSSLGIDEEDYLYYVNSEWFRKRLYKIPRDVGVADMSRYQYKGGDLVIDHIRWIPGGRYAVMEHRYWGILILEPATGKIGLLIRANGHSFGWYRKPALKT